MKVRGSRSPRADTRKLHRAVNRMGWWTLGASVAVAGLGHLLESRLGRGVLVERLGFLWFGLYLLAASAAIYGAGSPLFRWRGVEGGAFVESLVLLAFVLVLFLGVLSVPGFLDALERPAGSLPPGPVAPP